MIENPLLETPQGYRIDFDQLAACLAQRKPPLLLLCNPHNPTGRCWRREELERLMALCHAHDVTVISDEIWADLLLPGETFTSVLHLGEEYRERVIAATSASKTFGLSSLRISNFLIPNARLRQAFVDRLNAHGLDVFNALSMTAATAAINGALPGDELLDYLAENRCWFKQALADAAPWCTMTQAEGTYLAWLDCRSLGLNDADLQQALVAVAKLAPSMAAVSALRGAVLSVSTWGARAGISSVPSQGWHA